MIPTMLGITVITFVIIRLAPGDPAAMQSLDVRFSSPVYPGETIRTEIWVDRKVVSFRARAVERDVVVPGEGQVRAGEEPELLAFPGGSERDGAGDESPPEHHVKLPQQVGRQDQPVEMVHRPIDLAHSRLGPDRGRERPRPVEAYVDAPIETEQLNARHLDRVNVQDKRERIVPIVLRLGKPRNQGRQNEHHRQHPHLYVLHGFPRYQRLMRRRN